MTISVSGSQIQFNDSSTQTTAATGFGFKNRIINGAMMIDQRNAGASVTINSTSSTYVLDRWLGTGQATDGVFTMQRSTTAPAGFTNSLVVTVTTADSSIGSTQRYLIAQHIEGYNVSDLGFGTANASTVTLSFWVRSSVTGSFSAVLMNGGLDRSYPFTYTISSANTWEQKTVTIAGDTTGTWSTDSSAGFRIYFNLGSGSTYLGTANTWAATAYFGVTGTTNLIATNGATFYITGVQLEKGSTATSFDYRPYGTELALCQRYFLKSFDINTAPTNGATGFTSTITAYTTTNAYASYLPFPVTMRTTPTVATYRGGTATTDNLFAVYIGGGGGWLSITSNTPQPTEYGLSMQVNKTTSFSVAGSYMIFGNFTASAEL